MRCFKGFLVMRQGAMVVSCSADLAVAKRDAKPSADIEGL